MENIRDFYHEHKDQSQLAELLDRDFCGMINTALLDDVKPQALQQLKNLCGRDTQCMIEVTELLLSLPTARDMETRVRQRRRKDNKAASQTKIREKKRMAAELFELSPEDRNRVLVRLIDKTLEIRKNHPPVLNEKTGKENVLFNNIIAIVYLKAKDKTDTSLDDAIFTRISRLLTSFGVLSSKDKPYQRDSIRKFVTQRL